MRMCAIFILAVISIMSIAMPIQSGICLSGGDDTSCLITLDVCNKGADGIAASFDIPFVPQSNFVHNLLEPNTYGPDIHIPIISDAYLKALEKPPRV